MLWTIKNMNGLSEFYIGSIILWGLFDAFLIGLMWGMLWRVTRRVVN